MADQDDIEAAIAGEIDLVRRDFRGADFTGKELKDRDFSGSFIEGARLDGANLSGSVLSGVTMTDTPARQADLSGIVAHGSAFNSDFSGSDLRAAKLTGSVFGRSCIFSGADLRGALVDRGTIMEGASFKDAIIDETTKFDGTDVSRKTAADPTFRFYKVERGVLVRITENDETSAAHDQSKATALIAAQDALKALTALNADDFSTSTASPGIGHNNPPDPTPIDRSELSQVLIAVENVVQIVQSTHPERAQLSVQIAAVERTADKIAAWVARKADLAADEFAKQLGKTLADGRVLLAIWLTASGKLTALIEAVSAINW